MANQSHWSGLRPLAKNTSASVVSYADSRTSASSWLRFRGSAEQRRCIRLHLQEVRRLRDRPAKNNAAAAAGSHQEAFTPAAAFEPGIRIMMETVHRCTLTYLCDVVTELDAAAAADGLVAGMAEAASTISTDAGREEASTGVLQIACINTAAMAVLARHGGGSGSERRVAALGLASARLARVYAYLSGVPVAAAAACDTGWQRKRSTDELVPDVIEQRLPMASGD
jgi:hypothetical protein